MSTIHSSINYSQFKHFKGNREVSTSRLLKSIKKKNMLDSHPIIVVKDPDGPKMRDQFKVIDGQTRLECAKTLKVPIYYIIANDLEEKEIPLCQVQRPWELKNYLNFYHSTKKDYRQLKKWEVDYKISLSFLIEHTYHKTKGAFEAFRQGDFFIEKDPDEIERDLVLFEGIRDFCQPLLKSKLTRPCQDAIWRLIQMPDYIHEHFMEKLDKYREYFIDAFRYHSSSEILNRLVSNVYNRNTKDEKKKLKIPEIKIALINPFNIYDEKQLKLFV